MKCLIYTITILALTSLWAPKGHAQDFAALYRNLPFNMKPVDAPKIPARSFLLTDFGAVGDGTTLNTEAFANAVATVRKAGGGRLTVPAGIWFTGPISLCDNMELQLERGAVILFSSNFDLYPIIDTWFEGLRTKRCQSPLSALGLHDIAVTGEGIIDGAGDAWRPVKKSKLGPVEWKELVASGGVLNHKKDVWYPSQSAMRGAEMSDMNVPRNLDSEQQWAEVKDFLRPVLVSLTECERVKLEGVTFRNSPAWNVHPMLCKDLTVDGVTIQNPWYAQNGDGIDIESCDGVVLVNSSFDVGDDAICIKSGKDQQGRQRGIPTQNVIVDNCTVYHGHGGFVVGSEMSGGVRNVSVSDCRFLGTDVGLRFKSQRGRGGVVENIWIRNVVMTDIPTEPLLFDLFYGGKSASESLADGDQAAAGSVDMPLMPVDEGTPLFRNIHISRVICNNARRAMFFNGLPEMNIRNVTVEDCTISAELGAEICESESVVLRNVTIHPRRGASLVINNAKNITVENFVTPAGIPQALTVNGSRNSSIVISSPCITPANAMIAPPAKGKVTFRNTK